MRQGLGLRSSIPQGTGRWRGLVSLWASRTSLWTPGSGFSRLRPFRGMKEASTHCLRTLPAPAAYHSLPGAPSPGPADSLPALCLPVLTAALVPSGPCSGLCSSSSILHFCCKHSFHFQCQFLLSALRKLPSTSCSIHADWTWASFPCRKPLGSPSSRVWRSSLPHPHALSVPQGKPTYLLFH